MPLFSLCPGYLVNNRAERCTLSASLPGQGPFPTTVISHALADWRKEVHLC